MSFDSSCTQALCPHFGECGGCAYQDLLYPTQIRKKQETLEAMFAFAHTETIPVTPSPEYWHYRNKIDPTFGLKYYETPPPRDFVRETVFGFKRSGRWYHLLDIEDCFIGPEGTQPLFASVREWYRAHSYPGYDSRRNKGLLKNLLVREGKRTKQRLVALITGDGEIDTASFVSSVLSTYPCHSIHHAVTENRAGAVFCDSSTCLSGIDSIQEEMHVPDGNRVRTLRFTLSPFAFLQTNTLAAELLYGRIREWIREKRPRQIYDLYGGSGAISMVCADLVEHCVSVESVAAASEDGRQNCLLNQIDNVEFITQDVPKYLREYRETHGVFSGDALVVVDPPRSGLNPKGLRRLMELEPDCLVYVSCNPTLLARDELPVLLDRYMMEAIEGFDLFPHTPHVEVLALLRKKE